MLSLLRRSRRGTAPREGALLFIHIPKTAGTALRSSMARAYPRRQRAFIYDPADLRGAIDLSDFKALPPQRLAEMRLVMGHFPFGLHEAMPGPARYATMMRDPLDRVVSLYYHYRNNPHPADHSRSSSVHRFTKGSRSSLEDWVFERRIPQVDNGMLRLIVGRHVPFGECSDAMLTEALEHLEHSFDAVLIQARLAETLPLLEHVIGASLPRPRHRNVTRGRPPLDLVEPSVAARLLDLNRYDAELYRTAQERLEDDLRRLSPTV